MPSIANANEPDYAAWLRRWEAMMAGYFPERERQFAIMLDTIEVLVGHEFTAVDLGAGPGSTSRRLLDRFPRARCVAVDLDPLMIAMGRGAHGDRDGRLTWLEADLADSGWPSRTGAGSFDLAISTSAFHDFPPALLPEVYGNAGAALRAGGILLNGDTMRFGPGETLARRTVAAIGGLRADLSRAGESWEQLRLAMAADPWAGPLLAERDRRFASLRAGEFTPSTFADHVTAVRAAGFAQVDTIWQHLDFRLLLAACPSGAADAGEPARDGA